MPKFHIHCSYTAKITGWVNAELDLDGVGLGDPEDRILDAATSALEDHITYELREDSRHNFSVDSVETVDIDDVKLKACPECAGKGYTVSVIAEEDGLVKVGPCTSCLMVPTPKDALVELFSLVKEHVDKE